MRRGAAAASGVADPINRDVHASVDPEATHAYASETQTWVGERAFRFGEDARWDHGRAFLGSQRFPTEALTPGLELCIVKRVDASVVPQVSAWSVNGKDVSTTTLVVARPGTWGDVVAIVPA